MIDRAREVIDRFEVAFSGRSMLVAPQRAAHLVLVRRERHAQRGSVAPRGSLNCVPDQPHQPERDGWTYTNADLVARVENVVAILQPALTS
jgi:hypothetical protein